MYRYYVLFSYRVPLTHRVPLNPHSVPLLYLPAVAAKEKQRGRAPQFRALGEEGGSLLLLAGPPPGPGGGGLLTCPCSGGFPIRSKPSFIELKNSAR